MLPLFGRVLGRRSIHAKNSIVSVEEYLKDPVKIIVLPITRDKSFVYFKHTEEVKNKQSRIIKYENWLNVKAGNYWLKLNNSPKSYNKKIVRWVNFFLDKIPWQEHSLRSIPRENYILKRIKYNTGQEKLMTNNKYIQESLKNSMKVTPINIYYPNELMNANQVKEQLNRLIVRGTKYHLRYIFYCILGIQFTLPIVLVPIVPNIPGFYLAYRAYCNFQAYLGAKHIGTLLNDPINGTSNVQVSFKGINNYSKYFQTNINTKEQQINEFSHEIFLQDKDSRDQLLSFLQLPEMKKELEKAIHQETLLIKK
ncbi:hypothetical protein TBLA_0A05920 [Henningerozyma blattae CBS 6284]|uniref:Uncharacterized protein n=1 Tax=Henningerozyma blattae (strain ATCC 34711 / CBS 6284 / DSM 70876 / NBRC 10599 / NRRL Y-10934 / UCD 77-7) TaxID=1071380 RepID=I2GW83_HENB6|nr:hypothetical protein TBLA_0A05920 [Tetrapisispora blattae CBS 6284]CCH58385.1 hypothetical protein TBLA_0A05920 [Tetrapisispora blattae CBS 6284]